MSHLGPTLLTPRLLLRPPAAEDFDAWARMMLDEDAVRFIGGTTPPSVTWRGMRSVAGAWALDGFSMFSVIERSTGAWVGRLGPHCPQGWPGTEVGYGLVRSAWGQGYATEGCTAAIDWAVEHLGWTDIIQVIHPDNTASQAVARRLGARNRGKGALPAPFEQSRVDIWGQSAAEWRARRA